MQECTDLEQSTTECEAAGILGLETSPQTRSGKPPEIYREDNKPGKVFQTGPVFLSQGKMRLVVSEPRPRSHKIGVMPSVFACSAISQRLHFNGSRPARAIAQLFPASWLGTNVSYSRNLCKADAGTKLRVVKAARPTLTGNGPTGKENHATHVSCTYIEHGKGSTTLQRLFCL
ncbi:hypothetical protein IG631_02277 [Alternaria alternata]|nr:hypothetical protein IG631_02277 [Alternaria alternata]